MTNAQGRAEVEFEVSMQPGDNFKIVATCLSDYFDNLQAKQNDGALARVQHTQGWFVPSNNITELLAVWRKLHVETDSMVRPAFTQNTWTMPWNEPRAGVSASLIVFDADDPFGNPFQTNTQQFLHGYVKLKDSAGNIILSALIIDYVNSGVGDDTVTINVPDCGGGQSGLTCLNGITSGTAIFSDDDLTNKTLFDAMIWGTDDLYANGGSLLPPDLSQLQIQYHPAYIDPVQDTAASAVQGLTVFLQNQGFGVLDNNGKALWDQAKAARNLPRSVPSFWTVMAVTAWQEEDTADFDPDLEGAIESGITLGINTHPNGSTQAISGLGTTYTGICTIFKGVLGELGGRESFTVAHEIGHTFGLSHCDGGLMCPSDLCQTTPFTPISIQKLRQYNGP